MMTHLPTMASISSSPILSKGKGSPFRSSTSSPPQNSPSSTTSPIQSYLVRWVRLASGRVHQISHAVLHQMSFLLYSGSEIQTYTVVKFMAQDIEIDQTAFSFKLHRID